MLDLIPGTVFTDPDADMHTPDAEPLVVPDPRD